MTLTEFLTARLDEDEALARRERPADGGWHHDWHTDVCGYRQGEYSEPCQCHVPARVLAEVEAKRRIVEWHAAGHYCTDHGNMESWYLPADPCPTMRALALPYADHPDYDEAWRV